MSRLSGVCSSTSGFSYQHIEPSLELFQETWEWQQDPSWRQFVIPYAVHGDEGRGKLRKPIMVLSVQPLLTSELHSNMQGCLAEGGAPSSCVAAESPPSGRVFNGGTVTSGDSSAAFAVP